MCLHAQSSCVLIASCLFKTLCSLGIVLEALEAGGFGTCMKDAKRENRPPRTEESDFAPASAQVSHPHRSTVPLHGPKPWTNQTISMKQSSELGLHLGITSVGRPKRAEIEDLFH